MLYCWVSTWFIWLKIFFMWYVFHQSLQHSKCHISFCANCKQNDKLWNVTEVHLHLLHIYKTSTWNQQFFHNSSWQMLLFVVICTMNLLLFHSSTNVYSSTFSPKYWHLKWAKKNTHSQKVVEIARCIWFWDCKWQQPADRVNDSKRKVHEKIEWKGSLFWATEVLEKSKSQSLGMIWIPVIAR